jgi:enterochelin esterase-like enzyme
LHGLGGNERNWIGLGKIQETADRLIANGTIPPIAIVMPTGENSWNADSAAHGAIGSTVLENLFPHAEKNMACAMTLPDDSLLDFRWEDTARFGWRSCIPDGFGPRPV